jgi:hypothetical protein
MADRESSQQQSGARASAPPTSAAQIGAERQTHPAPRIAPFAPARPGAGVGAQAQQMLLQLQRSAGNAAVARMLAGQRQPRPAQAPLQRTPIQRQPVIQRTKLGSGKLSTAKTYVQWYFRDPAAKQNKGDALRDIYKQIGVEADVVHTTQTKLVQNEIIDADDVKDLDKSVTAYLGGGKAALPPERKRMTPETWRHIWRGDFNQNKNRPSGYHWKGQGGDSWLVGTGTTGRTQGDFYEEEVQVRDDKVDTIQAATGAKRGDINGKVKENMSTFFPDDWSEADIKDAIELRDSLGAITSKPAAGIKLVKSGVTIFPEIQ